MKTRTENATRKQAEPIGPELMRLLLPMTTAVAATKKGMMELVHRLGLAALGELLRVDAEELVGEKGRRQRGRERNHWGTAPGELTFGGRRVQVARPRVRHRERGEVALPLWELVSARDPLPERVEQQIALGVSTRRYADSLEPMPADVITRGTSKSAASRALIAKTSARMPTAPADRPTLCATSRCVRASTHFCLRISRTCRMFSRSVAIAPPGATDRSTAPASLHQPLFHLVPALITMVRSA
ncbi:MAG: hypothetical protein ABI200_02555 [Gaiellales bacterium]